MKTHFRTYSKYEDRIYSQEQDYETFDEVLKDLIDGQDDYQTETILKIEVSTGDDGKQIFTTTDVTEDIIDALIRHYIDCPNTQFEYEQFAQGHTAQSPAHPIASELYEYVQVHDF